MPINLTAKTKAAARPRKTVPAPAERETTPSSPSPAPATSDGALTVADAFSGRTTLNVREVGEFLAMTGQQVSNLIETGEIFAINVAGRLSSRKSWRVTPSMLQAFIDRRTSI